jgi:hypothetical protein
MTHPQTCRDSNNNTPRRVKSLGQEQFQAANAQRKKSKHFKDARSQYDQLLHDDLVVIVRGMLGGMEAIKQ